MNYNAYIILIECLDKCSSCSDGNSCDTCKSPSNKLNDGTCNCKKGYYLSGYTCNSCP